MRKSKERMSVFLIAGSILLSACGQNIQVVPGEIESAADAQPEATEGDTRAEGDKITFLSGARKSLLSEEVIYYDTDLVPNVPAIAVASDFSNVYDPLQILDEDGLYGYLNIKESLLSEQFAVADNSSSEFFDIYETNRYQCMPSFVTVDSLMHTYHLYFAYLCKHTELNYLSGKLSELSRQMLEETLAQYDELKGTDWEEAALRTAAYFAVGASLQDASVPDTITDEQVADIVQEELARIDAAEGIEDSSITGKPEDYSQYIVRGYYKGNETLEQYFRAMMWYGRIAFEAKETLHDRCAVLISLALSAIGTDDWNDIYAVTGFFAGASDDCGYYEYIDAINEAYGSVPQVADLPGETAQFDSFVALAQAMTPPRINSIPVEESEDNSIISYRFMGQRFTVDGTIFQNLIYRAVGENANGENRMLPDALDVPAALGSQSALAILDAQGDTGYKDYPENLQKLQTALEEADASLWQASLYASWLYTLRPLLEERGEGYPLYMQSEEWTKKNLETFAGSYAELKHDTILYAKQTMAEMGGGDMETYDDRGYVDPQPVIYSRFINLAVQTRDGLQDMKMLSKTDEENLNRLITMAQMMLSISEKELQGIEPSEDEYEFIRCYGGDLEHFWLEVNSEEFDDSLIYSFQAPGAIIADIATDPNGSVLEIGTGNVNDLYVIVPINGELRLTRGSVYSFYQFEWPMSDRLTDEAWREMLVPQYDENYELIESSTPSQPEWTQGYRCVSESLW